MRLNGREPKKPRGAESGLGWALTITAVDPAAAGRSRRPCPTALPRRTLAVGGPAVGHRGDCRRRNGFPALAPVGTGGPGPDADDPVQQEDALARPRGRSPWTRAGIPDQTRAPCRCWPGCGGWGGSAVNGEGQADCVTGRRVGVLAHDQDLDLRQRLPEGAENVRRRGQDVVARRGFLARNARTPAARLDRRQGGGPVGGHQLSQRHFGQPGVADGLGRGASSSNRASDSNTVNRQG